MANSIIKNAGFHHIALRVKDYEKSYKFYTEALGFAPFLAWGEGDGRISLLDIGDGGYLELFAGGKGDTPDGLFWHLAFRTTDVDGAYAAAIAGGAAPDKPPFDVALAGRNVRIAFIKGFDGETLEFFDMKN